MRTESILDNWIVKNLLWALIMVVSIILLVNISLAVATRHGRTVTVPDFTNKTLNEAQREAAAAGVKVEIGDSVFVRRMKKGAVFSQNPKAGAKVKKGRRVLLTTNAVAAKEVSMPSLVGYSMRQAKAELSSKGLMLGRLIYVRDMATNNVLRQLYSNREITPGTPVESGSSIDLVVGLNPEDGTTYAPDVKGLRYLRAVDAVQENSLNIGRLSFDSSVKTYSDSLDAVVYDQRPPAVSVPLQMGANVTLYLTTDESKLDPSR